MYAVFACEDVTEEGGQMTNKYDITSRSYSYKGDIVEEGVHFCLPRRYSDLLRRNLRRLSTNNLSVPGERD